jgi:tRNA A-37 threonylcarbamoyl transferase component Bud32
MSPHATAPKGLDDLLALLRRARLLDEEQGRRLACGWPVDLSAADGVRQLVEAGLLTAFQAEQVLAGQARRLRLGPYRLLDRLGGRHGRVYKAEHVLMKRLVTLKVLGRPRPHRRAAPSAETAAPLEQARTPRAGRRNELTIVAGLSHPNLVSALHATRLRGRLVLVLEYIQGIDLEECVAQTGPLPVALVREVLRQTAQALAYLHRQGFVHRDVKPANIILSHGGAGATPLVKLIDLGLACRTGSDPDEMCGTMDYLAPERGMGGKTDIRSDLYSLGCTLYQLLTGQVPHPGGSWTSKLLRHRMDEPVTLTTLRPDVPPDLAAVVTRLMAHEVGARFSDPQSLLDRLDQPPPAAPVAQPVARPIPLVPRQRRHTTLVMSLLAALCSGATLGGLSRLSWPASLTAGPAVVSGALPAPVLRAAGPEEVITDLERAIRTAPAEATLIVRGRGPHRLPPVAWRGRSLTIRAAGNERPRIERADVAGANWDALLSCEGNLVLEGVELSGGSGLDRVAPVVSVSGGALTLRDCRVEAGTAGPLIALRGGRSLRLERTTIDARAQAVAVEQALGRGVDLSITDSQVRVRDVMGPAILVWAGEPGPSSLGKVVLRGCRIEAGRVLACRALGGELGVRAERCRFIFHQALLSVDAWPDRHEWTRRLHWREKDNTYQAIGAWARLDGRPVVWDEASWRRLWSGQP